MRLVGTGKYIAVHLPNKKQTREHRLILHQIDPRPNEDELVVHHIDGNKSNNDPSNLLWMTNSEHTRLHHLGENHHPCSGKDSPSYKHGMCVGGESKEYARLKHKKYYQRHREDLIARTVAYKEAHPDHVRWYQALYRWQ